MDSAMWPFGSPHARIAEYSWSFVSLQHTHYIPSRHGKTPPRLSAHRIGFMALAIGGFAIFLEGLMRSVLRFASGIQLLLTHEPYTAHRA